MVDLVNSLFSVIRQYVAWLFKAYIAPGVSIGSVFLLCLLFYVIVDVFWVRFHS